jgi:hypothetical protein
MICYRSKRVCQVPVRKLCILFTMCNETWLIKHINRGLEFLVILNRGERGGRANKKIWKKCKRNAILRTKNIYTTYFKN